MTFRALAVISIVAASSFACGGDDGPEKDGQTIVDAGSDAGADASLNVTTVDGGADAEPDAEETPEPAESPICRGGTIDGEDGCVDSQVIEIEVSWSRLAPNGLLSVVEFIPGEIFDYEPDVEEPINDYCFYREELQNADVGPPCFDIGTITTEVAGLSDTATFDAESCYLESTIRKPFMTAGIDVSWSGGDDAVAGAISGTAPAVPAIDVGFASNGNLRILREEDDGYDGPLFFRVTRVEEDGVLRSIECYTPGNETLVVAADDIEAFGGFAGASWRAEFIEATLDAESNPPVRLLTNAGRSGRFEP